MSEQNESSCESDESICHFKKIKKLEEAQKYYTSTVKINAMKKQLLIDTGSPITIRPMDKRKLTETKDNKPIPRC